MYNEYPKNVITRLRSESENFCLSSDTCAVLCEAADLIEQQMRCIDRLYDKVCRMKKEIEGHGYPVTLVDGDKQP